jgi:hypothetical protein
LFPTTTKDISTLLGNQISNTPQVSDNSALTAAPALSLKLQTVDHYNNAKCKDIICCPINPTYDGSPDTLISFLNCLDIQMQDKTWKSVTFITHKNNT